LPTRPTTLSVAAAVGSGRDDGLEEEVGKGIARVLHLSTESRGAGRLASHGGGRLPVRGSVGADVVVVVVVVFVTDPPLEEILMKELGVLAGPAGTTDPPTPGVFALVVIAFLE
jgi:hypothetical protein